MEIEVILTTESEITSDQVKSVGKIINKVFNSKVVGGKGQKICTKKKDHDGVHYTFEFEHVNSEDLCDVLASKMYAELDFDFEVQVECEIDEDYLEPCDDDDSQILIDSDSQEHNKWVSECIDEGWTYGGDYNTEKKTSPFLKPFNTLSETQKKVLIKSKNKRGVYGIDDETLDECYQG